MKKELKIKAEMMMDEEVKVAVIRLCDVVIGDDVLNPDGSVAKYGVHATDIVDTIEWAKQYQRANRVLVRINCPGGNVVEGLSIYDALKKCGLPVRTEVYGVAASAATVVALAGDTVSMSSGSMWMVHQPKFGTYGEVSEIEKALEWFRDAKKKVFELYAAKTGKSAEMVDADHAVAVYYTAEKAKAYGFIDEVIGETALEESNPVPENPKAAMSATERLFAMTAQMAGLMGFPDLFRRPDAAGVTEADLNARVLELQAQMNGEIDLRRRSEADFKVRAEALDKREAALNAREEGFEAKVETEVEARMEALGVPVDKLPPAVVALPAAPTPEAGQLSADEVYRDGGLDALLIAGRAGKLARA